MATTYNGYLSRYLWRDDRTGHCLFLFRTKSHLRMPELYSSKNIEEDVDGNMETWYTLTVSALDVAVPYYDVKTPLEISGFFLNKKHNEKYKSWSFKLESIQEKANDNTLMLSYLLSYDIGKEDAEQVLSVAGSDGLFFFAQRPNAATIIADNTTLTKRSAEHLITTINRTPLERDLYEWLGKMDIPFASCVKAVRFWGKSAKETILINPYLACERLNLPFAAADRIAKSGGFSSVGEDRMMALTHDVFTKISEEGHTWVGTDVYQRVLKSSLLSGAFLERFQETYQHVFSSVGIGESFQEGAVVYSKRLKKAEMLIAGDVVRICKGRGLRRNDVMPLILTAEQACGIQYGKQQKDAFINILGTSGGIDILTGGPGTGKTSTIKGILTAYRKLYPNNTISLCAPTGRAAQRLSESTGDEASTIHRLLEYKPYGDSLTHKDSNNPIEADLIVVDEMSMVDVELFSIFLQAVKTETKIILVGDTNQLEAVGPGTILKDLLRSQKLGLTYSLLTEVYRQKNGSPVIENAIRIQQNRTDMMTTDDFQIINTTSSKESLETVKRAMKSLWNREDPFETQILCPAKGGLSGIESINASMQEMLNPNKKGEIRFGKQTFRINDKVIMIRNNYEMDYFNGDLGIIKGVRDNNVVVSIRDIEKELPRDLLEDMRLAYGMTIHKSQGCEFQNIIIVMPTKPKRMLVRNLFYTAVTRAKKRVIIINENEAMELAIQTDRSDNRQTFLSGLL